MRAAALTGCLVQLLAFVSADLDPQKCLMCEIGAEEIYKYMTDSLQKWKSTGSANPLPERDSSLKHAFNTTVNENWQNYGAEFRAAALDLLDLEDYEDMLSPTFAGVTKTADIKPAMALKLKELVCTKEKGWCPRRAPAPLKKGTKCEACKELVQSFWHYLPTVLDGAAPSLNAAQRSAKVITMVEEFCAHFPLRRAKFKDTARFCEAKMEEHANEIGRVIVANAHADGGELAILEGVCTDILEVCTAKQAATRLEL